MKKYYMCTQGKYVTTAYLENFQNVVGVLTHSGGELARHPGVENVIMEELGLTLGNMTAQEEADVVAESFAQSTAMAFLLDATVPTMANSLKTLTMTSCTSKVGDMRY